MEVSLHKKAIGLGLVSAALIALALSSFESRRAVVPRDPLPEPGSPQVTGATPSATVANRSGREPSPREPGIYGRVTQPPPIASANARVCATCSAATCRGDAPRSVCVRADADGRYALRRIAAAHYWVSASAPGYAPALAPGDSDGRLRLAPGQQLQGVDIALRDPGARVAGRVVDAAGRPLANAEIRAAAASADGAIVSVNSDRDGRFALDVPAGATWLQASASGHAALEQSTVAPIADLQLVLELAGSVSGQLVDASTGAPLPGVTLVASRHAALLLTGGEARAVSGLGGEYRLEGLPAGNYLLMARGSGWFGEREDVQVRSGADTSGIVVGMDRAATVAGVVRLERLEQLEGNLAGPSPGPCEQGSVSLSASDGVAAAPGAIAAIERGGQVRFEAVSPGRYQVVVACDGLPEQRDYPALEVAGESLAGLVWEVRRGARIVGQVVDARGRGLPEREVVAQALELDAPGFVAGHAISGPHGEFALDVLEPGKYRVSVVPQLNEGVELTLAEGTPPPAITLSSEASPLRAGIRTRAPAARAAVP